MELGSQRSLVELVHEKEEVISLPALGGTKRVMVATVHLQTDSGDSIPIETIIVPKIAAVL